MSAKLLGTVILLELMWNDPWWRSLLHLLFVVITYGKVSLWLWKSLENAGNFFLLLCGHPVIAQFNKNLFIPTSFWVWLQSLFPAVVMFFLFIDNHCTDRSVIAEQWSISVDVIEQSEHSIVVRPYSHSNYLAGRNLTKVFQFCDILRMLC